MDTSPNVSRHKLIIDIFKKVNVMQDDSAALGAEDFRMFEGAVRRESASGPMLCLQLLTAANQAKKTGLKALSKQLAELASAGIKQLRVEQQHDDKHGEPVEAFPLQRHHRRPRRLQRRRGHALRQCDGTRGFIQ